MYQAELCGKLPSRLSKSEDILTSNVFSFMKYADRLIFLRTYLDSLGVRVSDQDAKKAEFLFWPMYDDQTEPDIVLIVGEYYLLIEAKYRSAFAPVQKLDQHQLMREYAGGKEEADRFGKRFKLIVITADSFFESGLFGNLPQWLQKKIVWTNWQAVTNLLNKIIETIPGIPVGEKAFAQDLINLLIQKRLRTFEGASSFSEVDFLQSSKQVFLFFDPSSAEFGGGFLGFSHLVDKTEVEEIAALFFVKPEGRHFFDIRFDDLIADTENFQFFGGNCGKKKLIKQTGLAFDLIQKLYNEVAFLIKEIEGQLYEAEEKFIIGKPTGYQVSYISSSGLDVVNVKKWLPRNMSVFFVPEEMTEQGSTTKTPFTDETKLIYMRIILDDDAENEPVLFFGVLYGFINIGTKKTKFKKIEQIPTHIEYRINSVFKNPYKIDHEDGYVRFKGIMQKQSLFDLQNAGDVKAFIVDPSLKLFRSIQDQT